MRSCEFISIIERAVHQDTTWSTHPKKRNHWLVRPLLLISRCSPIDRLDTSYDDDDLPDGLRSFDFTHTRHHGSAIIAISR